MYQQMLNYSDGEHSKNEVMIFYGLIILKSHRNGFFGEIIALGILNDLRLFLQTKSLP